MNNIQIFAKALLEQIEVARVRQLSGLQESTNVKHTDTARAIRIFQKNLGLDQTGVPDPKTMHMIKMVAEAEQSLWGKYAPTWLGGDPAKPAAPAPKPAPKPAAPATQPAGGAPAGKSDPAVLKQQQDLIAKGAKIKADGIMGPATQAAIKQFGGAAAPAAGPARDPGTGELKSSAVDLNSPAMSALNQPGIAPTQGNSLSNSPNQEAEINAPAAAPAAAAPAAPAAAAPAAAAPSTPAAKPVPNPGADTGMTDRNPYDDDALAKERLDAHQKQQVKYSDQAAAPAAAPAPAAPAPAAPAPAAPAAPAPAAPAAPAQKKGLLDRLGFGKDAAGNSAPQQGGFVAPTTESRLREDPELTAMLRIAGLR